MRPGEHGTVRSTKVWCSCGQLLLSRAVSVIVCSGLFFRRFRKIATNGYWLRLACCLFLCVPHGTVMLPVDIWWTFVFELFFFSKICRENSSWIEIQQKWQVLSMKVCSHFWQYLTDYLLEWEMLQIKLQRKSRHRFYVQYLFFRKSCRLR